MGRSRVRRGAKDGDGVCVCVDEHRIIAVAVYWEVEVGVREGREHCSGLRWGRRRREEGGRERRERAGRRVAMVGRFVRWGCVFRVGEVGFVVGLIAALGCCPRSSSDLFFSEFTVFTPIRDPSPRFDEGKKGIRHMISRN